MDPILFSGVSQCFNENVVIKMLLKNVDECVYLFLLGNDVGGGIM